MWICTNRGFLSIVDAANDTANLAVLARRAGDIEAIFPDYADHVEAAEVGEYPFRADIPRYVVAAEIASHIADIDYPAFPCASKGSHAGALDAALAACAQPA